MQQFKETFFQREFQDLNDLLQQLEQVKVQDTARLLEQFEQAFRSQDSGQRQAIIITRTDISWSSFSTQRSCYDDSNRHFVVKFPA